MATDPYAAPRARVADLPAPAGDGQFIPEGEAVGAGNAWQWIVDAWGLFKQQPGMWIAIVVIFFVLFFVIGLIPFVGGLAAALLGPVFAGGIALGCRALHQGGELEIGHLFAGFQQNLGRLLTIGVINLVAWVAIGIVVAVLAGGSMAVVMMGGGDPAAKAGIGMGTLLLASLVAMALAVPLYMGIWFAAPLVALNGLEPVAAVKASFTACLKNIVPFLVYGVIMFVLAVFASLPLMLGWLVLGPVLAASVYTAYRDVFYAG